MFYPGNVKKEYNRQINYANRGMDLENLLNQSNEYYLETNRAVIYKKPTPITISEVKYGAKERVITKAYFRTPSTLDYNGIYRGLYIDYDAKETKNKTSFPLANLHEHQLLHIKRVIEHGGISFLIIYMNNNFYYLDGKDIINFIEESDRKSIPFSYIEDKGFIIEQKIKPRLNYLDIIDQIYFKED
ncbi:MAG: Holliday junction resolvase RecU [Bacilli bacterium]|nr:Holliday junction resolvase RecU [Bacilli bacterium]